MSFPSSPLDGSAISCAEATSKPASLSPAASLLLQGCWPVLRFDPKNCQHQSCFGNTQDPLCLEHSFLLVVRQSAFSAGCSLLADCVIFATSTYFTQASLTVQQSSWLIMHACIAGHPCNLRTYGSCRQMIGLAIWPIGFGRFGRSSSSVVVVPHWY